MNPEDTKKKIEELEKRVSLLMKFMEDKKRQQISFPVDETSKKLLIDITA
jgi:hypothetical protein